MSTQKKRRDIITYPDKYQPCSLTILEKTSRGCHTQRGANLSTGAREDPRSLGRPATIKPRRLLSRKRRNSEGGGSASVKTDKKMLSGLIFESMGESDSPEKKGTVGVA